MDINALHKKGFDLNGTAGTDFFSFAGGEVPVVKNPKNIGAAVVTANFQDVNTNPSAAGHLDYSDFKLEYVGGAGGADYTLTRVRDNQVINLTANPTAVGGVVSLSFAASQPANIDVSDVPGIDITVDENASISLGDKFVIRPTYSAAQKIGVNIDDPRKIAAATNIELDPVSQQPVQQLSGGVPVVDALGNPVYVTLQGPMPGDNRNALQLADLANKASLLGGTASYNDTYGQIVSGVGTLTRAAELGSSAQEVLLNQSKEAWEGLSGVNLDEEAANLIKFQQAYQASAQAISVTKSLFETLVGAIR
jgi:flagellar hook-associated protein 1 FlgK